ncbi:MAG: HAD hydrolase family protein [Lachnospiraceae bacterium]|nr:HAD hydrolase family protein [Lachnospiraceae bacterium]
MECSWNDIVLIVSDFDGVMTDNRVMIDETGKESVYVSRADGQGINILRAMGIELVILSTETNNVVKKRAEKLRVECIHGVKDKAEHLTAYCYKRNIELKNVAYIGNDINDYDAMQLAGMKIVPCDAYEEVKHIADYVTTVKGGYGVVREIAGLIKSAREKS